MTPLERYLRTEDDLAARLAQASIALRAAQRECNHPVASVVEAPYEVDPTGLNHHFPPFRVCSLCGYSETGWGSGYWLLHNSPPKVQRVSRHRGHELAKPSLNSQRDQHYARFGYSPRGLADD